MKMKKGVHGSGRCRFDQPAAAEYVAGLRVKPMAVACQSCAYFSPRNCLRHAEPSAGALGNCI